MATASVLEPSAPPSPPAPQDMWVMCSFAAPRRSGVPALGAVDSDGDRLLSRESHGDRPQPPRRPEYRAATTQSDQII